MLNCIRRGMMAARRDAGNAILHVVISFTKCSLVLSYITLNRVKIQPFCLQSFSVGCAHRAASVLEEFNPPSSAKIPAYSSLFLRFLLCSSRHIIITSSSLIPSFLFISFLFPRQLLLPPSNKPSNGAAVRHRGASQTSSSVIPSSLSFENTS